LTANRGEFFTKIIGEDVSRFSRTPHNQKGHYENESLHNAILYPI
jgi:hypothetical protein